MKPTGDHLLVRRYPYDQHGLIHLTEKLKMDFILSRPQVYLVLARAEGRTPRSRALLAEIAVGDRVICYSDHEGPVATGRENEFIVTLAQVLAVLPRSPEPVDGMWWCKSHRRRATHTDALGRYHCDPGLVGIFPPCDVIFTIKP